MGKVLSKRLSKDHAILGLRAFYQTDEFKQILLEDYKLSPSEHMGAFWQSNHMGTFWQSNLDPHMRDVFKKPEMDLFLANPTIQSYVYEWHIADIS